MLDKIDASHFQPLIGKTCSLKISDGSDLQIVINKVIANPEARPPFAEEGSREPFTVLATSTEQTTFNGGLCTFELENFGTVEGLHISRTIPFGRDGTKAYYQIVFN